MLVKVWPILTLVVMLCTPDSVVHYVHIVGFTVAQNQEHNIDLVDCGAVLVCELLRFYCVRIFKVGT